MKTAEKSKRNRVGLIAVLAVCLLALFGIGGSDQNSRAQAAPADKKEIVIEVEEDIPAMDIEEQEVPLAASPNTHTRSGVRHAVLMGVFLAGAIGYAGYFTRYDKKLFRLRKEAAGLEYQAMMRKKEEKNQGEEQL